MNVERFFTHHGLNENPFRAEEARHDPVFERLLGGDEQHPDFSKIVGSIEHPSSAVVFGEKGSGKTAIRLQVDRRVLQHNRDVKDRRTLLVAYDDWNPVLDRVVQHHARRIGFRKASKLGPEQLLEHMRLEDHQDAILSLAVTRVNDAMLSLRPELSESVPLPEDLDKQMRKLPRQKRVDWAVLTALYDQPSSGGMAGRWRKIVSRLRVGSVLPIPWPRLLGTALLIVAVAMFVSQYVVNPVPVWLLPAAAILAAAGAVALGVWGWRHVQLWRVVRDVRRQIPAVERSRAELRQMLLDLRHDDVRGQPWPTVDVSDARYQLTARLRGFLAEIGYSGLMVLVDRVDEPQMVAGRPERMKPIVWPMLENKFLQQDRLGIKLLLPLELRRELLSESPQFFQVARLDKQNFIDRLNWSGVTLLDLCNARMRACRSSAAEGEVSLMNLFEPDVTPALVIDALDQMHQPRDAFKFIYSVIQEHCRMVPDEQPSFRIPRLVLEAVRRAQSQRVQELGRGLSPA